MRSFTLSPPPGPPRSAIKPPPGPAKSVFAARLPAPPQTEITARGYGPESIARLSGAAAIGYYAELGQLPTARTHRVPAIADCREGDTESTRMHCTNEPSCANSSRLPACASIMAAQSAKTFPPPEVDAHGYDEHKEARRRGVQLRLPGNTITIQQGVGTPTTINVLSLARTATLLRCCARRFCRRRGLGCLTRKVLSRH